MSRHVDAQIAIALTQLGEAAETNTVHRRCDLITRGISDTLIVAMLRRGELIRLRHGIYVLRHVYEHAKPGDRHRLDLAAAIAAAREPAWSFGPSAALLQGMPLPFSVPSRLALVRASGADERRLNRPSRHRLLLPDATVITGPITPSNVMVVSGVPAVTPALAAISAAAELTSSRWRTALMDAAMWQGASSDLLMQLVDTWRQLGHRSNLISAIQDARPGAQTVLETFSRLAFLEDGLPEPILQHPFYDADGLIGYVDMWWPELNVIGEADGLVKYNDRNDVIREKRREDRLRALGPAVVRWTFEDIDERPQAIAAAIRRAAHRAA